ncbi:ATP-binding protein [Halovivax cerinus]|uniref:ATP-binding protein n=1 Tax=Halovivax cerinus TaxID=1487865 RepID=A0ABD5NRC5_9EURY|nr:ATP-binding protein [Halovivax cerinus]
MTGSRDVSFEAVERIVDGAPFANAIVDSTFEVRHCNRRWVDAVEASGVESVIGTSVLEYLPPRERPRAKSRFDRVVDTGESVPERSYDFVTGTGVTKSATGSIAPLPGDDCVLVMLRDVTRRDETERELATRSRQIEGLHNAAIRINASTDAREVCERIVTAIEDVLNMERCMVGLIEDGRLVRGAASAGFPSDGYIEPTIDEQDVLAIRAYERDEAIRLDDGDEHPVMRDDYPWKSIIFVPISDYGVIQTPSESTYAFDETDVELVSIVAAHSEEALRRIERERELAERSSELETLKAVYSRVLRHNLRNSFTVIKGHATAARERARRYDDDQLQSATEGLIEVAETMLAHAEKTRVIDDVMESRETTRHRLASVVAEAVERVESDHPGARIAVESVPDDRFVTAHPKLSIAISNAVENAVVHTDDPVSVTVSAAVDEADETASIVVEDTGAGIPPAEITPVREHTEEPLAHGSGVGFWLMSFLMRVSDGDLSIENTAKGSRVALTLPLVESV